MFPFMIYIDYNVTLQVSSGNHVLFMSHALNKYFMKY